MLLKLCLLIQYQIRNTFIGKSCRKYALEASPRPLLKFGKYPKRAVACKKLFLKYDTLKEDYQKTLKKLISFFLSNTLPFNGQSYQSKRSLELVTCCSSGYKTSLEKFLYSL